MEEGHKQEKSGTEEGKKKRSFNLAGLKKENFVVMLLMGVLLLVIALPVSGEKEKAGENQKGSLTEAGGGKRAESFPLKEDGRAEEETALGSLSGEADYGKAYVRELERTLEEILSSMEGAGRVKVMITLRASSEAVVEKDTVTDTGNTTEVDSAGGSRNTAQNGQSAQTVYREDAKGSSAPYVKQVLSPQIEGVLVSAQGGKHESVNKNITEAIQALFGIEAHKIKVIKMSS